MWEEVFKRYWRVTILKESPGNTPYSSLLFILVTVLFFLLIVLQWYLADLKQEFNPATSTLTAITLLCSYFVYTYLLLKIYRRAHRALQTLTALLISHMIVHFCAFPLLLVTPTLVNADMSQMVALLVGVAYLILTLLLTIWQFLVTVHIYKNALDVNYLNAVLASFGLLACNVLTVSFWR